MAALVPANMGDVVATTLRYLNKPNYTDLMSDLQEYSFTEDFLLKDGMKKTLPGGVGIQFDVAVSDSGTAANMGLNEIDNPNIVDGMIQARVEWCYTSANWSYLYQEESMNGGREEMIVDLIEFRRNQCLVSKIKLMERNWWGPPVALSDNITPWGVNTWVVKNATEGFNGGAPSGYTTIGNINPTTYPNWKNYTFQYTNVTPDDFVRKLARAMRFTHFNNPVKHPDTSTGDKMALYSNNGVIQPLEELLRSSNDNLGADIIKYQNSVMVNNVPLRWVPYLEADTTNPIYGLNKGSFKLNILQNWWDRETVIPHYAGQHNMTTTFIDSMYNFVCYDRRKQFVGATATTYPS